MKHLNMIEMAMLASILLVTLGFEDDKNNEVNLSATAIDIDRDLSVI